MLVGNKCDETESRELTTKDGEEQARKWSCHFMETSAKNNHNVKELFQVLFKSTLLYPIYTMILRSTVTQSYSTARNEF